MCRELIHIYGPIAIHSYGAMMFLGLVIVIFLMLADPMRKRIMNRDQLFNALAFGLICGIAGARILYLACNWGNVDHWGRIFALWDGGLSMMGGIIGILIGLPVYCRLQKIPTLLAFDTFAVYSPILQATTRIGCFLAGCCYGSATNVFWGICYHELNCSGPFNQPIHPVQLYSSLLNIGIFISLFWFRKRFYEKPGQLISLALLLLGFERFVADFWRGDREFFPQDFIGFLSIHQFLALLVAGCGLIAFLIFSQRKTSINEHI